MDWITVAATIGRLMLGMLLGGIVGIEREMADKPAGLRTHMLVAGASTLFVVLGGLLTTHFAAEESGMLSSDPIRIIQAVVVGISFLSAGTIIRRSQTERVEGLTTAATILVASAIGIAVALDEYVLAAATAIITLIVLVGVKFIEDALPRKWKDSEETHS